MNTNVHRQFLQLDPGELLNKLANIPESERDPIFRSQSYYCRDWEGLQCVTLYPLADLRTKKNLNKSISSEKYNDLKNDVNFNELVNIVYREDHKLVVNDINN